MGYLKLHRVYDKLSRPKKMAERNVTTNLQLRRARENESTVLHFPWLRISQSRLRIDEGASGGGGDTSRGNLPRSGRHTKIGNA